MSKKKIINKCSTGDKCILKIDGKYFGYGKDPQYPEATFKDIKKAYVFTTQSGALSVTTWWGGEKFTLIPVNE